MKYSREYFQEELGIGQETIDELSIPENQDISEIPESYIAGLFGGAGRFTPLVNQSTEREVGYALGIGVQIQRAKFDKVVLTQMVISSMSVTLRVN